MAVPIINNGNEKHLFFPLKTTSPAIPVCQQNKFNDILIKSCAVKAVNIINTDSIPDFLWNGEKREWIEDTTVVSSDFVNNSYDTPFNILKNTNFNTYLNFSKNYYESENWNILAENINSNFNSRKNTISLKITTKENSLDQIIGEINNDGDWANSTFLSEQKYSPTIETKQFGDGYNLLLTNTRNIYLGIRQFFEKPSFLFDNKISFSYFLRTNSQKYGVVARISFYNQYGELVSSQQTSPISNKNGTISIKVKGMFDIPSESWQYAAFDLFLNGGSDNGASALIKKIQLEYGENYNPEWDCNVEEIALNLNGGEVEAPINNGKIDKNELISHFSILRSTLSDDVHKWDEIAKVNVSNINKAIYNDYFIENGDYYRYALQPIYMNGRKGKITKYQDVVSTYEGLWILGENDIQFNFIYNGQLTNIVNQNSMELVNTINSEFPYYVSNNIMNYKTFTIQGILCQNQDVEELFINNMFSKIIPENTTDYDPRIEDKYNYEKMINYKTDLENNKDSMVAQRRWREQIVAWMENGKPKVIKSEAQGCSVVMLENVTVQPNKTTYGLIADFSAKCTELGHFTEEDIQRLKIRNKNIDIKELN